VDVMTMMRNGAMVLSNLGKKHTAAHAAAGFSAEEWELLTKVEPWTAEERRGVRSVLAEAVNVTMAIAGLPAEPLPGQYVAAVISTLIHPVNRHVAAIRAPETYDAVAASGLVGSSEIVPMTPQQMVGLVMAYSGGARAPDIRPTWTDLYGDETERADGKE